MLNNIQEMASMFQPISLSELDSVQLQSRIDSKFYFRIEKLGEILKQLLPYYRLLEVNGTSVQRYTSCYFDTDNFMLYKQHHNSIGNRFKIRFRNYIDSRLCYLEIKFKNNKGRTVKHRLKTSEMKLDKTAENFITDKTSFNPDLFHNKLTVNYSRLTFVNIKDCERVTLDLFLSYEIDNSKVDFSTLVIAEVKQDLSNLDSPFIKIMLGQNINEGGISKYCLGIASLYTKVKLNLFKENINHIKKLIS